MAEEVGQTEIANVQVDVAPLAEVEIEGVRKTLIEVLANTELSFDKSEVVKTGP